MKKASKNHPSALSEDFGPSPESIFQGISTKEFAQLGAANRGQQLAEARLSQAVREFYKKLPPGYRLLPQPEVFSGEPSFAVLDECGNDVGWPLTASECHERAWRHYSECGPEPRQPRPLFATDPDCVAAQAEVDRFKADAAVAGQGLDALRKRAEELCQAQRAERAKAQLDAEAVFELIGE